MAGTEFAGGGDYRSRAFYKILYTSGGLEAAVAARRALGRSLSRGLARLIGAGYAATHPRTLAQVRKNIALLDLKKATPRAAAAVCIHQALNFADYAELAVRDVRHPLEILGAKSGLEHIDSALADGNGCILATGHFGFFELGGMVMSAMGRRIVVLTLAEHNEALTRWRADFRRRWGIETLVVGGDFFSSVEVVRKLREGALVALLADRPFDGNSVDVDLPNGRIPFSTAPVVLSLLSGAPIVAVGAWRMPGGRFRIEAQPAVRPAWLPEGRAESIAKFTRELACGRMIPMFAEAPDQWHHYAPLEK
jgi:KDO2-lipid IV(A) lauroyltransferase